MSQSITATRWPWAARPAARLTVTEDLPTPPLPEATARTLVVDSSPQKVIFFCSWAAPGGDHRLALVLGHHPEVDLDPGDAGQGRDGRGHVPGDAVLERAAGHGEEHLDGDQAARVDGDVLDHVELGDGPVDLGVHHLPEGCQYLFARDHQRRFPSEPCRAKPPASWSVAAAGAPRRG